VNAGDDRGVWVLAEQTDGRVLGVSHELLTRGRELADKRGVALTAVLMGRGVGDGDLQELIDRGADRVVYVDSPALAHFLPQPQAACLSALIEQRKPEIVIAAATSTGRTLMPYVAIRVHAGLTADCTVLDIEPETGDLLQTRPAIGGNIMATIRTAEHRPQMATVRPHSTRPAPRVEGRPGEIERVEPPTDLPAGGVRRVDFIANTEAHPLSEAEVVVAVGRGIRKGENVEIGRRLADALEAALGASRDVVDRGWLSYPHQIGLSGKTVTPRLYVGVGVSGSIQHLAGMQTAESIIAVNTDPDAQIFQVADIGIVGDLFEVLPVLIEKIAAAKEGGS
jgi:electron transfer flavoprotein alpha subunit